MPPRPALPTANWALLGFFALGLVACQSPGSSRIVGPDGSAMAHVHCGSDQGACFRIAGDLCPTGYEMKPVLSGNDGNFLVRCRAAGAAAVAAATPASPAPASPPTLALPAPAPAPQGALSSTRGAPGQSWPPSNEPWPAAYPWPAPETSSGVRPVPSGVPGQEVDLGY